MKFDLKVIEIKTVTTKLKEVAMLKYLEATLILRIKMKTGSQQGAML